VTQAPPASRYLRYRNPDSRCKFPFKDEEYGFCWSYSKHVDRVAGFEDMLEICRGCPNWKGVKKARP
jgi:hypothetical protein